MSTRGPQKKAYQHRQYLKRKWQIKLTRMGFSMVEAKILVERYL